MCFPGDQSWLDRDPRSPATETVGDSWREIFFTDLLPFLSINRPYQSAESVFFKGNVRTAQV